MGDKMICPKCGIMVGEGRSSCQNCGSVLPGKTPFEEYTQQPTAQAPSGEAPSGLAPHQIGHTKKGKKKLFSIVIVIIIIVAVISFIAWDNQVNLSIDDVETEGDHVMVKIENWGWGDANGDSIEVSFNYGERMKWTAGDIEAGETLECEFQPDTFFIREVHVYYSGWEQDMVS